MHYRGVECLNCSHPLDLTDRYCAYCGQLNTTKRLTLADFFKEFMLSIFTYDSRFRHTVKDLLFKPGTITRFYVDGKRFHYANPFRFFLSASIIYFVLLGVTDIFSGADDFNDNNNFQINTDNATVLEQEDAEAIIDSIEKELEGNNVKVNLNNLEDGINSAIKANKQIQELKKDTSYIGYKYVAEDTLAAEAWVPQIAQKGKLFYDFYKATDIKSSFEALDSLKYSKSKTNIWLYNRNETYKRIEDNPVRFFRYLASKTPFFLFFLAPVLCLFFWLIYSKKKYNYMEHLVFIFHIFSFVFLYLLITYIPELLLGDNGIFPGILMAIIGPFYFYKALRNFYKQNRVITLIKFVFLNTTYFILASVTALIFFAVTAALY